MRRIMAIFLICALFILGCSDDKPTEIKMSPEIPGGCSVWMKDAKACVPNTMQQMMGQETNKVYPVYVKNIFNEDKNIRIYVDNPNDPLFLDFDGEEIQLTQNDSFDAKPIYEKSQSMNLSPNSTGNYTVGLYYVGLTKGIASFTLKMEYFDNAEWHDYAEYRLYLKNE